MFITWEVRRAEQQVEKGKLTGVVVVPRNTVGRVMPLMEVGSEDEPAQPASQAQIDVGVGQEVVAGDSALPLAERVRRPQPTAPGV